MPKMIFVSLPVTDLGRSIAFYEAIGCEKNEAFSNDQAAMLTWSDTISFMLLTYGFYQGFTSRSIADAHQTSQVLLCLSRDSRADVDAITQAALGAGGREHREGQDMGFMYSRSFEDPDGHVFEPMWMDAEAAMSGAHEQPVAA
jgi:hypothetical protein